MSADNWQICPKCGQDNWRGLLGEPEAPRTLREDWDIGMSQSGEFEVGYSCSCKECGFKWRFHSKTLAKDVLSSKSKRPLKRMF